MKRNKFLIPIVLLIYCLINSCNEYATIGPPQEELNDITSPPSGFINELAINSRGDFFAATQDGLFISSDQGSTWWSLSLSRNTGSGITEIKITSDDYIYISYYSLNSSNFLRSSDNGNSWTVLPSTMLFIGEVEEDHYGNIYVAGSGLQKSTDKGNNWEVIYSGLVFDVCFPNNHSIVMGISQPFPGQILYSSNNGNSWDSTGYKIHVGSFHLYDSLIFAGGVSSRLGGGGIHNSTDGGRLWNATGLSYASTTSFITNNQNKLFVGASGGIYSSLDSGETWQNAIADTVAITFMKDKTGFLYAGTIWGTFLRSTDNGTTWHN